VANIAFIAGGELENLAEHTWLSVPLTNSEAPVSGVAGAHGKVYELAIWGILNTSFPVTALVTVKCRWRFRVSSDNQPFLHLYDGATEQIRFVYRSTGAIQVVRQSTVLATSATGLFNVDTWYELEVRARISNGSGSVAVNRNGAQIICLPSGQDTQTSSTGQVDHWILGNEVLDSYFDDCVVDRSGTYLGTGEVETLMPNGEGEITQLTPSALVANYTLVNEKPHDSNTTYVESNGDQTDTYQFENRSLSGTPLGVMLSVAARHTVGAPTCKLVCRIDGVNYESTTTFSTLSIFRGHFLYAWAVNPATGEAWTDAAINAAEWGVHCLATGVRVTQVGLQVYVKTAESDQCLASGASRDYCGSINEDVN